MGRRLLSAAATDRLLRSHVAAAGGGAAISDLPDLCEEDVWSTAHGGGGRTRWRREDGGDRRLHVGGLSRALQDGGYQAGMSAPVSLSSPEWGRTGTDRVWPDEASGLVGEEEEEREEWVPPHVYLARKHGKTALATSVFEGVGRTLKGRDMSRVRNAVWSQTGFFG